jgi:hypothetical protein
MIQLRQDIAWVRAEDGRLMPFDTDRLTKSIEQACEFVGHADRLLAESVAAAIHHYVGEQESDRTISASEISRIVLMVLSTLTRDCIARAYARRREWTEIRLDELGGFELDFYRQLDEALRTASVTDETSMMQLRGLRACVMRLCGAQRWGESCRALADEIVDFVRVRVLRTRPSSAGALRMEVLE